MTTNTCKMKIYLLTLIMFLLVSSLKSQDEITLKTGLNVKYTILQVNSWGLTLEDDKAIPFKIIKSLTTCNKDVAQLIKTSLPSVELIMNRDSCVHVNFSNVTLPKQKKIKKKTFNFKNLNLTTTFSSMEASRFKIALNTVFYENLIFRLGYGYSSFSTNVYPVNPELLGLNENIDKRNYHIFGPVFTFGYYKDYDLNRFLILLNTAFYTIQLNSKHNSTLRENYLDEAISLEMIYNRYIVLNKFYLYFGLLQYLNKINVKNNDTSTGITIGLGWHLK